jgi:hypothetical protein
MTWSVLGVMLLGALCFVLGYLLGRADLHYAGLTGRRWGVDAPRPAPLAFKQAKSNRS